MMSSHDVQFSWSDSEMTYNFFSSYLFWMNAYSPVLKKVDYIMYECTLNVHSQCCHYNMTYQLQLLHFTTIHKSSSVASQDSKTPIVCKLQNIGRRSGSFGKFSILFYVDINLVTYSFYLP